MLHFRWRRFVQRLGLRLELRTPLQLEEAVRVRVHTKMHHNAGSRRDAQTAGVTGSAARAHAGTASEQCRAMRRDLHFEAVRVGVCGPGKGTTGGGVETRGAETLQCDTCLL